MRISCILSILAVASGSLREGPDKMGKMGPFNTDWAEFEDVPLNDPPVVTREVSSHNQGGQASSMTNVSDSSDEDDY